MWDGDAFMAHSKSGGIVAGPDVFDPGRFHRTVRSLGAPRTFLRPRIAGALVATLVVAISDSRTAPRSLRLVCQRHRLTAIRIANTVGTRRGRPTCEEPTKLPNPRSSRKFTRLGLHKS